jgi:hypothetical protein
VADVLDDLSWSRRPSSRHERISSMKRLTGSDGCNLWIRYVRLLNWATIHIRQANLLPLNGPGNYRTAGI